MSNRASLELQEAIYQTLTVNVDLTNLLGGAKIYDHVPKRTKPPYITIGMTQERDWSTSTEEGREHLITIHSWTENRGRKIAKDIIIALQNAMSSAQLNMPTQKLVNLVFEFNEIRRDPDGDTIHGISRYRIKTEPL